MHYMDFDVQNSTGVTVGSACRQVPMLVWYIFKKWYLIAIELMLYKNIVITIK